MESLDRDERREHPGFSVDSETPVVSPRSPRFRQKTIVLRVPAVVRAYAARIARRLEGLGHHVVVALSPDAKLPGSIDWLLYFERVAYRARSDSFEPATIDSTDAGCPDLVVDLAGDAGESATPTLRMIFESGAGETGLVGALLASRSPALSIVLTQTGAPPRTLWTARLAVERPLALGSALDVVTPRLATLIAQAVAALDAGLPEKAPPPDSPAPASATPFGFAARALAERIDRKLTALLRQPDQWRIAIRAIDGPGVMERFDWSGPAWRILPDDGRRYFADPFLFAWAGRQWLFCEEFPYATSKGILSVASVDANGTIGAPRPILETDGHLSWPQVFAHDGRVYMIPESATAGRIELWRADNFPTDWVLDRVLIDDIHAHDPVLHLTENGAFIIANVNDDGGSSWDALGLFHAPHLTGEWRAHAHNPVIVDASCVRGASPIIRRGDDLWRATQDCRTGYGDGLVLCRVTRLDAGGFAQDVVARLGTPPGMDAAGVHSLSRSGRFEAIDLRGVERTLLRA